MKESFVKLESSVVEPELDIVQEARRRWHKLEEILPVQVKTSEGLSKDKDLAKEHSARFKELVKVKELVREHSAKEQLNLGSQERWIEQEDLGMVVVVQWNVQVEVECAVGIETKLR